MKQYLARLARAALGSNVNSTQKLKQDFQTALIHKTNNFGDVLWLGVPVWQDILSLWTIQETIVEVGPQLLIECGTNRGGSAFFFATLFDLMHRGRVVTIDIERMHDLQHDRIHWIIGDSTSPAVIDQVTMHTREIEGPVMVILDSDHSKVHVLRELNAYHQFVTRDSYLIVQDGIIDTLPIFEAARPGPLQAIREFTQGHPNFTIDEARSDRFLITHHPCGWLKRVS
jgi:cephalosporin hydroxylase